ncbi:MAG: spheroidene monooxygenase [Pseudomonadota bacterium]
MASTLEEVRVEDVGAASLARDQSPSEDPLRGAPRSRMQYTAPARQTGHVTGRQVVTLTCFRFASLAARLRQVASMARGTAALNRLPGCGFARMMGTGTGEGFDPAPDTAVWTILAAWEDEAAARTGLVSEPLEGRAHRAAESCTFTMLPLTMTGRWGGVAPFECASEAPAGVPLAVLTRATVKPRHCAAFWRKVPAINRQIADGPGMLFRLGMGEVPLLHQVTFSIWRSATAMRDFAYRGAGHAAAIAAVRSGDWFSEELFARFAVLNVEGSWRGTPPLG